jgi:hypothetical protein
MSKLQLYQQRTELKSSPNILEKLTQKKEKFTQCSALSALKGLHRNRQRVDIISLLFQMELRSALNLYLLYKVCLRSSFDSYCK